MIGQLSGTIVEKQPPQLILNVQGVGYEIDAPMSTFYRLPEIHQTVLLHTHLVVREDAHQLFGFYTREERTLFRTLLKVNGVGPRLALTILSSFEPDAFVRCILNNDVTSLVNVPGIGKKTAERLMIEMRDKLADWQPVTLPQATANKLMEPKHHHVQDAIAALIALGYKPQEASRAVSKTDTEKLSSEEIIRQALKEMVVA